MGRNILSRIVTSLPHETFGFSSFQHRGAIFPSEVDRGAAMPVSAILICAIFRMDT